MHWKRLIAACILLAVPALDSAAAAACPQAGAKPRNNERETAHRTSYGKSEHRDERRRRRPARSGEQRETSHEQGERAHDND